MSFANDPEDRGWMGFEAMMAGGGGTVFGVLMGAILGSFVGPRVAIMAFATRGLLVSLIGAVGGFLGGFLVFGLLERDWRLAFGDAFGTAISFCWLGIIAGTIVGAWKAPR
jgi:hypothetical protein